MSSFLSELKYLDLESIFQKQFYQSIKQMSINNQHLPAFTQTQQKVLDNPESHHQPIVPFENGGSYCIPIQGMHKFYKQKLQSAQYSIKNYNKIIKEVRNFRHAIQNEQHIFNILVTALNKIPEGGVLSKATLDEFYHMISIICSQPLKYQNYSFTGIPFAALFVDLKNSEQGQQFFSKPLVNQHLRVIFNAYKQMLESPASLKYITTQEPHGWLSPTASKFTNWDDYYVDKSDPHWGFKHFNDLFTRPIRPEARPLDTRSNSIVHSSDSSPLHYPDQSYGKNPAFNVQAESQFLLKDNCYSLYDMLGAKEKGLQDLVDKHFVGGTVYQAILCPWFYHRWHAPISGTILHSYRLDGEYFRLNPKFVCGGKHQGLGNYVKSLPLISMVAVRQVFIIRIDDGSDRLVGLIEIGMTEVSSCYPTVEQGQKIEKGEQIGYFQYGGSSYALVFDKDMELQFNENIFKPEENGMVDIKYVNSHLATYK